MERIPITSGHDAPSLEEQEKLRRGDVLKERKNVRRTQIAVRNSPETKELFERLPHQRTRIKIIRLGLKVVFFDRQKQRDHNRRTFAQLARTMGTTDRSLENFPEKVRGMAAEIQKVNSSQLFAPQLLLPLGHDLPRDLRRYAACVDQRISERKACFSKSRQGWSDEGDQAIETLVNIMRETTGRPHFQGIADLLTKVAKINHVNKVYDVDAVKMRLQRYSLPVGRKKS